MSRAIYYARTKSVNDTGFDSYSVPFISNFSSKVVRRAIKEFKFEFPKSKMKWEVFVRYVDDKK